MENGNHKGNSFQTTTFHNKPWSSPNIDSPIVKNLKQVIINLKQVTHRKLRDHTFKE